MGMNLARSKRITLTYLVNHGSIVQHLSNLLGCEKTAGGKGARAYPRRGTVEKNWTRKEVCQQSEDMIRRTLEDDTPW